MFQVLNQFMTQIEQLEKTIDINEIAKNGNVKKLVRDGERKDARIQDLEEALKRQKSETESTKVELIDDIIKIIIKIKIISLNILSRIIIFIISMVIKGGLEEQERGD